MLRLLWIHLQIKVNMRSKIENKKINKKQKDRKRAKGEDEKPTCTNYGVGITCFGDITGREVDYTN